MEHWEALSEWESMSGSTMSEDSRGPHNPETLSEGSYHCKSALRSHTSNMKLFLYRSDFSYLHSATGADPYTEDSIKLVSDLWRCFYSGTHGLDRITSPITSIAHRESSHAFRRWSDRVLDEYLSGDILEQVLSGETHIWSDVISAVDFKREAHQEIIMKLRPALDLLLFLNYSVFILNNIKETRSTNDITIPGIAKKRDDRMMACYYNDYLKLTITSNAIRVITPAYDQIMQRDIFLTISDKINERVNTVIGCILIDWLKKKLQPDTVSTTQAKDTILFAVDKVIRFGDDLIQKHGNVGFTLLGKFEAYCISVILSRDDRELWDSDEFKNNLLIDDLKNSPNLHQDALNLCQILSELDDTTIGEMHGLWRIWGHPIIDLEGGLKKMEETSLKVHAINKKETTTCNRTFLYTFFTNYFKMHQHYPLSNLTPHDDFLLYKDMLLERDISDYQNNQTSSTTPSYLRSQIQSNKPINPMNSAYRHHDWDSVVLLQCFQVPQSINLATMIKDKAISMTRKELIESVSTRRSVFDKEKRRGILKWLSSQSSRVRDYLYKIDNEGIDEDDSIIGLYPKEREMKIKARFFSLMSYNLRMFVTITEELIGRHVLKYFPMITMSDTLLKMIIRLYDMTTSIGATDQRVTYCMNIDFSKWNQNMREHTNAGIFAMIDRSLGFRSLISRTHDIFRKCYLYLCSGEYIPSIVDRQLTTSSPFSRIGDESGKEGLRQKGWTITTVCDILSLAFQHQVQIELIGGGDNQVLTVKIAVPKQDINKARTIQMNNIKQRMIRFRNSLAKKMEKRGLPLKLEETWISPRLLMYNKIMYLNGVPLQGRLKAISRIFSNSNEGIMTLGGVISTLSTGFQALSAKDYDPILAWITSRVICLLNISQFFHFNPITGATRFDRQLLLYQENIKNKVPIFGHDQPIFMSLRDKLFTAASTCHTLSKEQLFIIILYYHKILGGPGIGTPLSLLMKGFPDPLSEALTFNYSVIQETAHPMIKTYITCLTRVEKAQTYHWEHLLEDPVSINHNAPSHGIAALRANAEAILRRSPIKNSTFKQLINLGDNKYLRNLSETLCKHHELEPRILHDVVGATIPGYVNTVLSKVDKSTTLNKIAGDADIVKVIYEQEILYYIFLANKIHRSKGHVFSQCPTSDAALLRNSTWGRKIIGVTTPHPLAFLTPIEHNSDSPHCDQNYIMVLVKKEINNSSNPKRGQFRPYFGSYTEEKFKSGVLSSAYGDEDILRRAIKIQKLLGWRYKKGQYMYNLIQSILGCVTDASPEKFLPDVTEITGDVEHRYHDMATKHGGIPTNLIQLYTHTSCNTSTFIDHSKGAGNESLHFQAAIIYSSMVSILRTMKSRNCTTSIHFHESCTSCIKKIEIPNEEDRDIQGLKLLSCPSNDLMYVKEQDIPIHYHISYKFDKEQKRKATLISRKESILPDIDIYQKRPAWLIMLTASLYHDISSIKDSTLTLYFQDMDISEISYLICGILKLHVMSKGLLPSSRNMSHILDFLVKYSHMIDILSKTRVFTTYCHDNFYVIPTSPDMMRSGSEMMEIIVGLEEKIKPITGVIPIKFQEPWCAPSKILLLADLNPYSGTCTICMEHIIRSGTEEDQLACSSHGAIKKDLVYHTYSLDNLAKSKLSISTWKHDTESSRANTVSQDLGTGMYEADSRKRIKRNDGRSQLVLSLEESQARVSNKRLLNRRSNILFTGFLYQDIQRLITFNSLSSTLTLPDDPKESAPDMLLDFISQDTLTDFIEPKIRLMISRYQQLVIILNDMLCNIDQPKESTLISLSLDITLEQADLLIWQQVFLMTVELLKKLEIRVEVYLMISKIRQVEGLQLYLVEEMVKHVNSHYTNHGLIILHGGSDAMLDTVNVSGIVRAAVSEDVELLSSLTATTTLYTLTNSDCAYSTLIKIKKLVDNNTYKVICIKPTFYLTLPMAIIIKVSPYTTTAYLSLAVGLEFLSHRVLRVPYEGLNSVLMRCYSSQGISATFELYKQFTNMGNIIASKEMFDKAIYALSKGLAYYALSESYRSSLPWQCIVMVKLILSLRIICSSNKNDALSYYAKFQGFSYKVGSYKVIILHRGFVQRQTAGYFVHITNKSLGPALREFAMEVESWMCPDWREDMKLSSKIHLM